MPLQRDRDICIIGGAGHVGLPLALVLARAGQHVLIFDVNQEALATIKRGTMPFVEYGAEPLLASALSEGRLDFSSDERDIARARAVIVAVGTPVDEYLNPKLRALLDLFRTIRPHLDPEQIIIIRSTVFPRTCRHVLRLLSKGGGVWHVAYCPERIAQGYAIRELDELPQIVSGCSDEAVERATEIFSLIAPSVIRLEVEEAELAKLFTNAWRYIQFAAANQFYMIAQTSGVDFNRVRKAMVEGYGRAASLPSAGFAAGPCLLKDTMQLAAFNANSFSLGQAAMGINEGLPSFLVESLKRRCKLDETRVGILGMAFKADIDDIRDSLSYKLGKVLRFNGADVYYSDEFARDPTFITKEQLVERSDVIVVGVPHTAYRTLVVPDHVEVIDLWGVIPAKTSNQAAPGAPTTSAWSAPGSTK
jgi:UDP-N-acetyl-D-mannosaminuronic acid dehydrogenase